MVQALSPVEFTHHHANDGPWLVHAVCVGLGDLAV